MPNIDMQKLRADIKLDEGTVLHAYQDSLGFWTIGSGILIDARKGGGISDYENDMLLDSRLTRILGNLDAKLPWILSKSDGVQRALGNMCYQLGVSGLLEFKNMVQLIKDGKYSQAADEALNSMWAKQTPNRAKRISDLIRKG